MVALHSLLFLAALTATPDAVLLEFYSPSCGPCRSMQPTIDRLKQDGYPIQQINVEAAPDVARQFSIRHVPTSVLVVDGKEVARLDGVRSRDDIERLFETAKTAAAQSTAEAEEEYIVRGQSPEGRRGLGLFNKLSGKKSSEPETPPYEMTNAAPAAAAIKPPPRIGQDPVFAKHTNNVATPAADARSFASPVESDEAANDPHAAALASTVCLKVQDPSGMSFGTGTIIDVLKDEALVVTCGHIFRDSQGKGTILVDLHLPNAKEPVPGQLISFDLKRDIALVSIRPGVEVNAAPVGGDVRRVVEGTRVFSVGCDHGREPSVVAGRITAINKYTGTPNYTATGMPVEGRSGGGLFLADGTLVGICNAADPEDQEGLYAALPTIHWQLDQIGQTAIYQRNSGSSAVAATPRNELPPTREVVPVTEETPAMDDTELIMVLRSKSRPRASETVVIERPTPELLDAVMQAQARQNCSLAGDDATARPIPTNVRILPEDPAVIVRGQNK